MTMDSQLKNSLFTPINTDVIPQVVATEQAHQLSAWLQQHKKTLHPSLQHQLSKLHSHNTAAAKTPDVLGANNLHTPHIQRLLGLGEQNIERQSQLGGTNSLEQACQTLEQSLRAHDHLIINTGELLFECHDFHIPGPISFSWRRIYRSSSSENFGLGPGWHHPLCERLIIGNQRVDYTDSQGRRITFGLPAIGSSCINRSERLVLQRQGQHSYRILGFDSASKLFRADGVNQYLPLVELRDALDNTISIDYQDGLPKKLITSWGRIVEFICANGHIHSIKSATAATEQSQLACYQYQQTEQIEQLTSTTNLYSNCESYQYQGQQLLSRTLACGKIYRFKWHQTSARFNSVSANSHTLRIRWQEKTRSAWVLETDGTSTFFQFNDKGQKTLSRDAQGHESKCFYDGYGNLCSETNALGYSRYYRFDNNGRPTRITDELGHCTQIRYDNRGQPALITDALGNHWQRRYNEHGLLVSERDPNGNTWRYQYNDKYQLESLQDPEQGKIQLQWNSQFELIKVTSANGISSEFNYDHWGRIVSVTTAGRETKYQYGSHNRLQQCIDAAGNTSSLEFNSAGQLRCTQEFNHNSLEHQYNDIGQRIASRNNQGQELQLQYNDQGLISQQQSAAGQQSWQYNHAGLVFEHTSSHNGANVHKQLYRYDACQRLIEYRNMDVITYIERDPCGRIVRQNTNSGDSIQFHYDALGRLTLADNGSSSIRYQYNACGKIVAEHHDTDFGVGHNLNHHYDKRGWRTKTSSDDLLARYLYNPDGQLYGIDINGESILRCDWDNTGLNREWVQGAVKSVLSYNPLAQLEQLECLLTSNQQSISQHQFEPAIKKSCGYFNLGLPEHATNSPLGLDCKFDQRGNIITDQNGPQSSNHYQYNGWNQLISAECGDFKTYFRYDPLGRRISKLTSHRKSKLSRHTLFKWNGDQLWSEEHHSDQAEHKNDATKKTDASPQKELIRYIFHPQLQAPVAMQRNEQLFYYQLNAHQQPLQIVDQQGELVWQAQYSNGQYNGLLAKPQVSSPWRDQHSYYDSETQLLLNSQGYYSQRLGRYIHAL